MSMFHLGWFLGPGITIQGWNEPGFATGYDWTKPDIFVDAARAMERACFDVFILEDSSAVPYAYQGKMDFYLKHATMTPKFDPVMVTPYLIAATKHIGLAPTLTTTFYPPWLLARSLATLDHYSERPHRLEHRHRHVRRGSAELRPRKADRPRPALRHGRRVRRLRKPAVGRLGAGRRRHGRGEPHLHRSQEGQGRELRGQVLQDARAAQRAALAAGPAGVRGARRLAARPPVRRPQRRDRAGRRRERRGHEGLSRRRDEARRRARPRHQPRSRRCSPACRQW